MTRPCTRRWNRLQRLCTDYIREFEPAVWQMFQREVAREIPPQTKEQARESAKQASLRRWQRVKGTSNVQ